MSTLAEIEAALPELSWEEMDALERRLHELRATREATGLPFTGIDAIQWWRQISHLPPDEAEAFARDVEAGRSEMNRPLGVPRWE